MNNDVNAEALAATAPEASPSIQSIPTTSIDLPKWWVSEVPTQHLEDLAADIDKEGLLHPITVRPKPNSPGRFELLAGEGRLESHRKLLRPSIEARVVEADDVDAQMIGFRENLRRKTLTAKQRNTYLKALTDLMEGKYGKPLRGRPPVNSAPRRNSKAEVAKLANTSERSVRREQHRLDPSKFCSEVREAVTDGRLKPACADELKGIPMEQQRDLLPKVLDQTRDGIRKIVRALKSGGEQLPSTSEPLPNHEAQKGTQPPCEGTKPIITTADMTTELFEATMKATKDVVHYGRLLLAGGHVDRLSTEQRSALSLHLEIALKVVTDVRADRKIKLAIVDDADRVAAGAPQSSVA